MIDTTEYSHSRPFSPKLLWYCVSQLATIQGRPVLFFILIIVTAQESSSTIDWRSEVLKNRGTAGEQASEREWLGE